MDTLKEEFKIGREILKNRREKDLLSADEYKSALDRLGKFHLTTNSIN